MGATARLLSIIFGGKLAFEQYLSLFAYSFFTFWILAHLLDISYSIVLGDFMIPALRDEYGAVVKVLVVGFPPVMWTVLLALGGIYNAIVTHEGEGFPVAKAGLIGVSTFIWPVILITFLIR